MYLQVKRKKIKIIELKGFWNRFKGLKFVLEPIDYGVKFSKKEIYHHKLFMSKNRYCTNR